MPHPATLAEWLAYVEALHPKSIALGLERSREVARRMRLSLGVPLITVAGTNGKGSTCAMLESILLAAGYRVGLYIKPHFLRFNERARVGGQDADDAALLPHFAAVETARVAGAAPVELTYYEFTTLAILSYLAASRLDVVILEVGLGGRLDTVNLFDADCSVVTSVDIDHVEYLGETREKIGFEKAGIFRPGRPAICGDPMAPASLVEHAAAVGSDLWLFGRDFNYSGDRQQWNFAGRSVRRASLPYPALRGANQLLNACAALAALEALAPLLPVSQQAVRTGLLEVVLVGRFQVLPGRPTVILDVAHNPHAAAALGENLNSMGFFPFTYAVFGAMADKDLEGVVAPLLPVVDRWFVSALNTPRSASGQRLSSAIETMARQEGTSAPTVDTFPEAGQAYAAALKAAGGDDRIVVFGSFYTVAAVLEARSRHTH